jgi:hypothetical protein
VIERGSIFSTQNNFIIIIFFIWLSACFSIHRIYFVFVLCFCFVEFDFLCFIVCIEINNVNVIEVGSIFSSKKMSLLFILLFVFFLLPFVLKSAIKTTLV